MAQNARDMVSRFGSVSDKFKKLLFDLQFGQLSPLNPRQRLDALRGQVGDLGRRARLGDVDAADELAELLPEFVQLSAEFNGFNKNFESDRAMAEDLARATKSVADRQLEIQKRILDETSQQTDLLAEMLGGGSGKGNANDKIYSLVQSGQLSTESAHAIIRAAGYTGPIGGGKVQAAFDADPAMNQRAWALLKAAGFASGGMVTGGVMGMDSVPAMLSPGEVVMRARAVQAIGAGTLLDANRTGRIANDNKVIEQLLGRLINVTQSLVNVTAASGNQTVAGLHGVQAELSDISNKARLRGGEVTLVWIVDITAHTSGSPDTVTLRFASFPGYNHPDATGYYPPRIKQPALDSPAYRGLRQDHRGQRSLLWRAGHQQQGRGL